MTEGKARGNIKPVSPQSRPTGPPPPPAPPSPRYLTKQELEKEVGAKYKMYFGPDNLNNKNIEIRAIVDGEHVVFKSWSKSKSRYVYSIESLYYFRLLLDQGSLKRR